ncbi:hypothetical protein ABGB17_26340 [Sphaerisporangium sp. B11E5]|uniref:hypothetical protein n=1 Tax=Sphaerisporangium sp. B11E5 TaxID=3153563 RepID=UPI00325D503C
MSPPDPDGGMQTPGEQHRPDRPTRIHGPHDDMEHHPDRPGTIPDPHGGMRTPGEQHRPDRPSTIPDRSAT